MFSKSIYRCVRNAVTGHKLVRVAVIGSKNSGKTVFLTSLVNHLLSEGSGLRLSPWSIESAKIEEVAHKDMSAFPYAAARQSLVEGRWPCKTAVCSALNMKFDLCKNGKRDRIRLEIIDLPGERVADFPMIGKSYKKWCDWMERHFGGGAGVSKAFQEYYKTVAMESNPQKIFSSYKDCVAKAYGELSLSVTPSVLKIDKDANSYSGKTAEQFRAAIESAPIGLGQDCQFAPLPMGSFNKGGALQKKHLKEFAAAYDKYKSVILKGLSGRFRHVNSVLYLVDVLDLLKRGWRNYNEEQRFADQALNRFARHDFDNRILRGTQQLLGTFVRTHVDSVYVLATKADLVSGEENRSRMGSLARQMLKKPLEAFRLPANKIDFMSCASVRTTEEWAAEKKLKGRVLDVETDGSLKKDETGNWIVTDTPYYVNDVPETWPSGAKWDCKQYNQRETFPPPFDARDDLPPDQLGLTWVVGKILGLQ